MVMVFLVEQLCFFLILVLSYFDLDEDEFDVIRVQVIDNGDGDGDIESEIVLVVSELCKKIVFFLYDVDKKYVGCKVLCVQIEVL